MSAMSRGLFRWALQAPKARALSTKARPPLSKSVKNTSKPFLRKPSPLPRKPSKPSNTRPEQPQHEPSRVEAVSTALQQASENNENSLLAPVYMPEDPNGVLKENHPAMNLLNNSTIVVQRQLEMMNVLLGFEQANRYVIMGPNGNHIGYLAEQEHGLGSTLARQMLRTHRSFTTHVFDRNQQEVLRFHRPFSWISSRIRVYDAASGGSYTPVSSTSLQDTVPGVTPTQISSLPLSSMRIVGEAHQQWAPLRRKYNMFLARDPSILDENDMNAPRITSGDLPLSSSKALQPIDASTDSREVAFRQFAYVNEPFLSWDFTLRAEDDRVLGTVNRNFAGFAREIFTDTGVYALRMDSASATEESRPVPTHSAEQGKISLDHPHLGMTLDQRAVMLATAVSIDFDYFSRHSGSGVGFFPIWFPMGGEAAGAGGAAGAGAAEVGAVGAGEAAGALGGAARGVGAAGAAETMAGAVGGAGTIAGYEAMQRARGQGQQPVDDASPQSWDPYDTQNGKTPGQSQPSNDVWGEQDPWGRDDQDPWSQGGGEDSGSDGGGGGEGGGGGSDWFSDFF